MARLSPNAPRRQPGDRGRVGGLGSGQGPGPSGWALAALALLLVSGVLLIFNEQHSGDALKIRRELRKF